MAGLTGPESALLTRHEATILSGLQSFWQVGQALTEIRDQRLYRGTHPAFEAYCQDRWGLGRAYADRLIQASQVVGNLLTIGGTSLPANEAQARPLAALPAEQQRQVWQEASEGEAAVTAARVEELAKKALAGLPPEEKRATVQREERLTRAAVEHNAQRQRLAQMERLQRRVLKLAEGCGPEAEEALLLIGRVLDWIDRQAA